MKRRDPLKLKHSPSAGIVPASVQDIGPFYPATEPADQSGNLTMVKGRAGAAQGHTVHLSGRVLDLKANPYPRQG